MYRCSPIIRSTLFILTVFSGIQTVYSSPEIQPLRSKIITQKGTVKVWERKKKQMHNLSGSSEITFDKTLILSKDASLHVAFEPLIEFIFGQSTTVKFDNLAIDRSKGTIRIRCNLEKGTLKIKAPPQAGHILLLTLTTPSMQLDASTIQMSITVDSVGTTTSDIHRGLAKILPYLDKLKTTLKSQQRCITYQNTKHMEIGAIPDNSRKEKSLFSEKMQPTIGILSMRPSKQIKENLDPISNKIAHEFEMASNAKILFLDDIRNLLHSEGNEPLLNCFTDSCISKIGSNAGVDIVIVGNVNKLGSTHILDLKMIDVLRDKLLSRSSVSVKDDIGLILTKIPTIINNLVVTDTVLSSVIQEPVVSGTQSASESYQEKVIWIFPGTFTMGSQSKKGNIDELPAHTIELDGFYIDRFEVTRAEFKKVMGYNPVPARGCTNCPVTNVTWKEASDYCSKLGKRLPTEAEWEYACRAGTQTVYHTGVSLSSEQANFNAQKPYYGSPVGKFNGKVIPIGDYPPNSWNLHDMHGNASEWCSDWYDVSYYGNSPKKNPKGPLKGKLKVVRGGSWNSAGEDVRSANRTAYNPELRLNTIGFRCVTTDMASGKK